MTLQMTKIRHHFPRPRVEDVAAATAALAPVRDRIRPGESIALTVGSRGIANIATIVKATVEAVKACGSACTLCIPAMGSHGGGTAEGQVEVWPPMG